MNLKKVRQFVLILTLLVLAGGIGYRLGLQRSYLNNFSTSSAPKADLSLFWHVWSLLEQKYVDKKAIDPQKMVYGAISGMVASLGDPYTAFFPPEDNKINRENLKGEFGGVGIQLGYKDGTLAVIAPLDNTPAARAGIKAGDLILRIKDKKAGIDKATDDVSLLEAVKLIRGKEGSKVTLTLAREGKSEPFDVEVVRGKIVIPTLVSRWIEKDGRRIAHVRLLQFNQVLYSQWDKEVSDIVSQKNDPNFAGMILDLRNNPGGFLQGAVYVAGEFLSSGVVVKQQYASGKEDVFRVNRTGRLPSVKLVVLVNRGSASASEILAGALQHYKRAVIVGERTFGKGTVQEPETLPQGAGLHVTISRWLLPDGRRLDKNGIKPDVLVEVSPDESMGGKQDKILEKGIEEVLKN
jgi:carboxyl-terminal processing protease